MEHNASVHSVMSEQRRCDYNHMFLNENIFWEMLFLGTTSLPNVLYFNIWHTGNFESEGIASYPSRFVVDQMWLSAIHSTILLNSINKKSCHLEQHRWAWRYYVNEINSDKEIQASYDFTLMHPISGQNMNQSSIVRTRE